MDPKERPRPLRALSEFSCLLRVELDTFAKQRFRKVIVLSVLSAIVGASIPIALKITVDALAADPSNETVLHLMLAVGMYVLLHSFFKGLMPVTMFAFLQGEQRLHRNLSTRYFSHLLSLSLRFHLRRQTGAVIETLDQGLRGCRSVLQHSIFTLLPVAVEFLAVIGALITFRHPSYLMIFLLSGIAYAIAFRRGAKSIIEPADTVACAQRQTRGLLLDGLLNYESVKYFNAAPLVCRQYDAAWRDTESKTRSFGKRIAVNGLLVAVIFGISLAASLFPTAWEIVTRNMTPGDFLLIGGYVIRIVQPLESIGNAVRDLTQSAVAASQLLAQLREPSEPDTGTLNATDTPCRTLKFDKISFTYDDQPALIDVSFELEAGQTLGIVGSSGSGKTTLIRLLFRLQEPTSGTITLDGVPLSAWSLASFRAVVGIVPQDICFFNDTIASNIACGLDCTLEDIQIAAQKACIHDHIQSLPQGYQTVVGERGARFSPGQRQRIALARMFLREVKIGVLDEATSALDSQIERRVQRAYRGALADSMTLIVAHRLSAVRYADQILVLEAGRVIERGTHDELLRLGGRYAALCEAQQAGLDESTVAA